MTTNKASTPTRNVRTFSVFDADNSSLVAVFYDRKAYDVFCRGLANTDHRLIEDGKRMMGPMDWVIEHDPIP